MCVGHNASAQCRFPHVTVPPRRCINLVPGALTTSRIAPHSPVAQGMLLNWKPFPSSVPDVKTFRFLIFTAYLLGGKLVDRIISWCCITMTNLSKVQRREHQTRVELETSSKHLFSHLPKVERPVVIITGQQENGSRRTTCLPSCDAISRRATKATKSAVSILEKGAYIHVCGVARGCPGALHQNTTKPDRHRSCSTRRISRRSSKDCRNFLDRCATRRAYEGQLQQCAGTLMACALRRKNPMSWLIHRSLETEHEMLCIPSPLAFSFLFCV